MKKYDFILSKDGDYQNVILVETIRAINKGLTPIMFRKDWMYEWRDGSPDAGDVWDGKICICPINKDFIDAIGIKLSDNPDFENVSKLEFVLRETIWGRHFLGLDIERSEDVDLLLSSYEKDENCVVQNLKPQDIFNAFWNKSDDKPEPTGEFKKLLKNQEEELPF
ncbi:MAG: hypothetical protein J1D77_07350 [Muribaculaceae bacterium]|nr:hypothetical protein [Muribaculaceae bacterium]